MTNGTKKVSPEFYGVLSEASDSSPEWYSTKEEAKEVARNIVQDNPTVTVHLYKAVSVGTLSMTPLATGEMNPSSQVATQPA